MLETLVPMRLGRALSSAVSPSLLLVVALVLLVLWLYRKAYERPHNFPPGPPRLPFWGSYWLLLWEDYKFLHRSLLTMTRRYKTKILGFYLGGFPSVVLTDYEDIKEMKARIEFAGRPDTSVARERSMGSRSGVIFSDGPSWLEERRFLLRHIRDFGWGRRFPAAEAVMLEEMRDAVDLLRGEWHDEAVVRDGRVLISHLFAPFGLNAVWSMVGGERIPRGQHAALRHIHATASTFFRVTDPSGGAVSLTPWLRFLTPRRWGLQDITDLNVPMRQFVLKGIREHRDALEEGHEARDFLDKYLQRMAELDGALPEVFSERQMLMTGVDMVTATMGALSGSVAFLWQQLLHHPEVQARVQREVDAVVGRDRQPTLDDRQHMPYTEATVRESMRRVTLAPLSLPHVALEDTTFKGYNIPKGTLMYAHLNAFHMDPTLWGDPENFRPERFLEADGSLTKRDITLPFGAGKRLCVGETFSRHMMFLFLAHILQSFTLLPDGPMPPLDHVLHGFTLGPEDLWARFVPRA